MSAMFDRGYALLIGVGESVYSKWSLPVTIKDTQAIYAALIDPELCGYPREQIRILNNAETTHAGILEGLNWLKEKVKADREATAIVYYSGHGWVDNEGKYYLIQHDVNPLKIATSALSADIFTEALREIQVDRLLIIIDSCHAAGMATSKEADDELMDDLEGFDRVAFSKGLIDSLKQGKGRVVFTSSEGHQKSWIDKERSLSIYTLHFLEALQGAGNQAGDREVRVSNLMNYLAKAVPETTRKIYNQEQTPHFDFDTGDFVIAQLRGGKGLPNKGWDEVKSEASQKINKIADKIEQHGKFITNINEANGLHIGDNFYGSENTTQNQNNVEQKGLENVTAGRDIVVHITQNGYTSNQPNTPVIASVDELVQQVRLLIHDDIQRLHGTMPLWGVDHWVPLINLFVDVNILEQMSKSRKLDLNDLWQDFNQNPSHQRLNRIGLGREQKRLSGLEIITKNVNLMLVGKPGSGKTTYLQHIITECNVGNIEMNRIPVLIRLREFVEDGRDFAYSLEIYLKEYWRLSNDETQLILKQGRAIILLDGLDELTEEITKNITNNIKKFTRNYPQVLLLVTCRTQSHESHLDRFDYVEIADFNESQVRAFAEHWFESVILDASLKKSKTREFLNILFSEENKSVRELAVTPILLSLTCAVFNETGKFYSKRSKLYQEGLELLLGKWDKYREIERDQIYHGLSVEKKKNLLSYLAIKKFEQAQYILFDQEEIEGYIAEFLEISKEDSQAVLKSIEAQHGLLIERAQNIWSFSHLTFQEYLVTLNFIRKDPQGKKLLQYLYEKKWGQVILMFSEKTADFDNFILFLKLHIDKSVSQYEKLQAILKWALLKTTNTSSDYSRTTLRAFYISLIAIINTIDELEPPWLPDCLIDDFSFLLSNLDKNIQLSIYHCCSNGLWLGNPSGSLEGEAEFDRHLCHARAHANLLERTTEADEARYILEKNEWMLKHEEEELEFIPDVDDSNLEEIGYDLDKAIRFCEENGWEILASELLKLYDQLPLETYGEEYKKCFSEHEESWAEKLRAVSIKYRQVDYQWHLTQRDWSVLYAYVYANRIAISCLNGNPEKQNNIIANFIRETLLIPYSEIESIMLGSH